MTYATQTLSKLNNLHYFGVIRSSAEKFWEAAQNSLKTTHRKNTVTATSLAHQNLLAMAMRAEQLSGSLTTFAQKFAQSAPKTASKPVLRKMAARAEPKSDVKASIRPAKAGIKTKVTRPSAKTKLVAASAAVA